MTGIAKTLLVLQDECYKHRYIRTKDSSHIVERPERLRALKVGFAAAIARLETRHKQENKDQNQIDPGDELSAALNKLTLATDTSSLNITDVCQIIRKAVKLKDLSSNAAVKMIHAATGDGAYDNFEHLERLRTWARESEEKVRNNESEIPAGYLQGDLYMCSQSYNAICGAVESVCDTIDTLYNSQSNDSAFVAIRPPGHHCGEDTPSGFCFVNNVAIGAAHAYLNHGVDRVIIFDIDLHHGNGTQSIAWQINAESHRRKLTEEQLVATGNPSLGRKGLQIFYASLHDILSYPCEDGVPELVRDASVSLSGLHGQFIENVHLKTYASHDDFWANLYTKSYSRLFEKAQEFIEMDPDDKNVSIFISCGFDASELEYPSMSRHGRKVPVGFYYRFAKDVKAFAKKWTNGKVMSVLEGGYSDKTLIAGGIAHLTGLIEEGDASRSGPEEWWAESHLEKLEKVAKRKRGARPSGTVVIEPWLERTLEVLAAIDPPQASPPPIHRKVSMPIQGERMSLRDRKKVDALPFPDQLSLLSPNSAAAKVTPAPTSPIKREEAPPPLTASSGANEFSSLFKEPTVRKLPKIILKVREPGT